MAGGDSGPLRYAHLGLNLPANLSRIVPEGSRSVAEAERTSFNVCVARRVLICGGKPETSDADWGRRSWYSDWGKYKQSMVPLYNVPTEIRQWFTYSRMMTSEQGEQKRRGTKGTWVMSLTTMCPSIWEASAKCGVCRRFPAAPT